MRLALAALLLLVPGAALAGTPTQAVEFFYKPHQFEFDPEFRDRFTGPVKLLFEKADAQSSDDEEDDNPGCLNQSLALDGRDHDEEELARSLQLSETIEGETAKVTAKFNIFAPENAPDVGREIVWTLQREGDRWLISDIASVTGDWTASAIPCEPTR